MVLICCSAVLPSGSVDLGEAEQAGRAEGDAGSFAAGRAYGSA